MQSARENAQEKSSRTPAREGLLKVTVKWRLEAEGPWAGKIELERDEMTKLNKKAIPNKRERQIFVYSELDRLYPPQDDPEETHIQKSISRTVSSAQRPVLQNAKRTVSYPTTMSGIPMMGRSKGFRTFLTAGWKPESGQFVGIVPFLLAMQVVLAHNADWR